MQIEPARAQHHCHHHHVTKFSSVMNILEKISAVALAVFAAYIDLELFAPFFLMGMAIGAYGYKESCKTGEPISACANAFLEQLTGVKLPAPVSLAVNLASIVCHIDHHPFVFVPIVAISIGAWAGKVAGYYGDLAYRNVTSQKTMAPY